jgi:type IV secretion system protein VirB11
MSAGSDLSRGDLSLLKSALGDDVLGMLSDENVSDILVRPWGISIDTFDRGLVETGIVPRPGQIDGVLRVTSGVVGGSVTERNPVVECKLPIAGGSRFAGIYYGEGESFYTLRNHRPRPIALSDYNRRPLTASQVARWEGMQRGGEEGGAEAAGSTQAVSVVRGLIAGRTPLLIHGPTGSGKTTLMQACVNEAAVLEPNAHYLIIEDTPELQSRAAHRTFMRTTPYLTLRDLARAALRHRPTWIIFGEVRGAEALDAINAAITGHPIMMTIHAHSSVAALTAVAARIGEAVVNVDYGRIVDAIGACIGVRRRRAAGVPDEYRISEVVAVDDVQVGRWQVRSLLQEGA